MWKEQVFENPKRAPGAGMQRTGRGTQNGISSQASLGGHENALGVLSNDLIRIFEKLGSRITGGWGKVVWERLPYCLNFNAYFLDIRLFPNKFW